ncbi:hypothetical protein K443DRAFT_10661 [Laccaria amethystina LaAM-08-1]|uniref:Uncharacterized protein n=1 Tax=Laccaria amethystina LaAM-08-1 TaxID=1095629 RepID=A0A0C9XJK0_9AGAR|nr:hypothetical protein K443DRAFT_10661 [Laccaria amethystina LaAM-08-1]
MYRVPQNALSLRTQRSPYHFESILQCIFLFVDYLFCIPIHLSFRGLVTISFDIAPKVCSWRSDQFMLVAVICGINMLPFVAPHQTFYLTPLRIVHLAPRQLACFALVSKSVFFDSRILTGSFTRFLVSLRPPSNVEVRTASTTNPIP